MKLATRYTWSIVLERVVKNVKRVLKKAAPRLELGIKDLQSSALPLGHAANLENNFPPFDRTSPKAQGVLVIANGHGEDQISLKILQALRQQSPNLSLSVMPLVGIGSAFEAGINEGWLTSLGHRSILPSGGFSNQSFKALIKDIFSGLLKSTWRQFCQIKSEAQKGQVIIAVGDSFPLFLAWLSGTSFCFVGTPKSDYTWTSTPGKCISDSYHRLKGTEWDPWEYWIMKSSRCKMVAVRDSLTARGLKSHGVNTYAPGNPMMDGLDKIPLPKNLLTFRRLLLLCGTRIPEAFQNFKRLIYGISISDFDSPTAVFVALGSKPSSEEIKPLLEELGFMPSIDLLEETGANSSWSKNNLIILLGNGLFSRWIGWAEIGISNSGTATEQLVGLGIPALSLPGKGPQFTKNFAQRQSRLLGGAVIPCSSADVLSKRLHLLLRENDLCRDLGLIGVKRMGPKGGSYALAKLITKHLLNNQKFY